MIDELNEYTFAVSDSPHINDKNTTDRIMIDIIMALIPAACMGVVFSGIKVLLLTLTCTFSCIIAEYFTRLILKRENTLYNMSSVVTGLLLAMNLPSTTPFWIGAIASIIAIVPVKEAFGGIGKNILNPALAAIVIIKLLFPSQIIYGDPGNVNEIVYYLKSGILLVGAIYLIYRRVINIEIPITYITAFSLFIWILGGTRLFEGNAIYHIVTIGLLLPAFFMATDYTTSPITTKGRIIMGIGCGVLTATFTLYTSLYQGYAYAILIMNILVPLIDRLSMLKCIWRFKQET